MNQTPIKRFVPNVMLQKIDKSRFLSNTHRNDARRILDTFGDTFMGVARATNGATVDELSESGIVSIHEAF